MGPMYSLSCRTYKVVCLVMVVGLPVFFFSFFFFFGVKFSIVGD